MAVLAAGILLDDNRAKLDVLFVVVGVVITLGAWMVREPWSSISLLAATVRVA